MIIKGITGIFVGPKRRPKPYRAVDAAYQTGGNAGFYIASRPRPYPLTSQQKKVKNVARECGVHAGISKRELQDKMKSCVGPKMGGY
jgi:hypothetical protein